MPIVTCILKSGLPCEQLSLMRWIRQSRVNSNVEDASETDTTLMRLFEDFLARFTQGGTQDECTSQEVVREMVLVLVKISDNCPLQRDFLMSSKIPLHLVEAMLSSKADDQLKETILLMFYKLTNRADQCKEIRSALIEERFLRQIVK